MKKMMQMYAAEEAIKYALPKVTQQFKNMSGPSQSRRHEESQPYQPAQPSHYDNYRSNYNQPSSSQHYDQNGRPKSGSGIGHTAGQVARTTYKAALSAGKKVKNMVDSESLKSMLKEGNIVQLVSTSSGGSIQILQDANNQLVLDGRGGVGQEWFNAHFHVSKDPVDHGLSFHNQGNYLAIVNGAVTLIHQDARQKLHPATKFKVKCENGHTVQLESVNERRRFIEVATNGQIKSAAFSSKDSPDAQFDIVVIFKVY